MKLLPDTKKASELKEFKNQVHMTSEKEFDGHTLFETLTPDQKLEWPSQGVVFAYNNKTKS